MDGERRMLPKVAREVALLSAVAAGAVLAVLLVYIAYVYTLWAQAMRAEGPPASPPS